MANTRKAASRETWVLVADARRAEIYCRHEPDGPLEIVQQLTDDEARARERDLVADRPGRSFDSGGQGRHAMEPAHTEKQHLRSAFAQRVARVLAAARIADRYAQLVIVAAPAMLGELRAQFDAPTASCVTAEFDKELAGQGPETIAKLIG
ncbi:MAG: host attachment protein [Gammaproteobacteria bacterium]|nr:host attachment protein [Gammaproteobacteria bacterium]MBT8443785.1 host attachment protein [Gammaproteobacteria bacterium]